MKNTFLFILFVALNSFKFAYDVRNNTAEVEQQEGLYIFADSKPIKDYEYLGSVKNTLTFGGQYTQVKNKLVSKARKEYPNADAIIIHFNSLGFDKADVIKFK